jgi:hypothetical protein
MRGIEAVLLAGFIVLIGLGAWNARRWLPDFGPTTVNSARVEKHEISAGEKAKTRDDRVKRAVLRNRTSGEYAIAAEIPVSTTDVEVPSAVFPRPKDLPIGASGLQIRARYGEPTVRVTETSGGHILERYYYFSSDRTQLTTATLEKGIIVSAESTNP